MDTDTLINFFSGTWRSSYTYGTSEMPEDLAFHANTFSRIQMHAMREEGAEHSSNPHLATQQQTSQSINITAAGTDEAGIYRVTGRVWKVRRSSETYFFQFSKAYDQWQWIQWGLVVGKILEGYWGMVRGDVQGYVRYEKIS